MKPSEAKVLEGLRKTTLAYLSDKEYAEVVEAVEKQGILGLTGAASRLVKGAVVKHGSHDQKTHGRKGGGGGGGGGSQVDAKESKQVQETVESAIKGYEDAEKEFENALEALDSRAESRQEIDSITRAGRNLKIAMKDIKESKSLKGDEQKAKLQSGVDKFENAIASLSKINVYRMDTEDFVQSVVDSLPTDTLVELGIDTGVLG